MKRLALVAAVLVIAACTTQKDEPATDTAAPAMAPAPATTDTAARMDSAATDSAAKADSARRDSAKTKTPE